MTGPTMWEISSRISKFFTELVVFKVKAQRSFSQIKTWKKKLFWSTWTASYLLVIIFLLAIFFSLRQLLCLNQELFQTCSTVTSKEKSSRNWFLLWNVNFPSANWIKRMSWNISCHESASIFISPFAFLRYLSFSFRSFRILDFHSALFLGRREVSSTCFQISWAYLRLHAWLVSTVATRSSCRCCTSFPRGFYSFESYRLAARSRKCPGIHTGECGWNGQRILPAVQTVDPRNAKDLSELLVQLQKRFRQ